MLSVDQAAVYLSGGIHEEDVERCEAEQSDGQEIGGAIDGLEDGVTKASGEIELFR
jgi:hypothetical protein